MNKTILFIDHDAGWTGSTVSMIYLLKAFVEEGFSVHVLTPKRDSAARKLRETGVSLLPLEKRRFNTIELSSHVFNARNPFTWKTPLLLLHEVVKVLWGIAVVSKAIRLTAPHLVYTNEHVTMQASIAAKLHRIPAVIHVRSLLLKGYLGLGRFLLSRLILTSNQAVIAITNREAEQLHARASERRKIKIVGEFFSLSDTHALRKNECRDCLGLPQHKKIVCMLGGIEEIKGTVIFLRAATLIASTNANVCFVLAGDDHVSNDRMRAYFDKCMEVAEPLRELGSLIILGHISNSMDLVKASDIIVSPSIISHFSRPVIEAWGFGKPVICSRTDHMQDLIDHRVNGLLFETGDHRQLAQCLSELLADSKFAKKMGVEGKRKVERDFKAEVNTRAIVNECVSLIATHDSV